MEIRRMQSLQQNPASPLRSSLIPASAATSNGVPIVRPAPPASRATRPPPKVNPIMAPRARPYIPKDSNNVNPNSEYSPTKLARFSDKAYSPDKENNSSNFGNNVAGDAHRLMKMQAEEQEKISRDYLYKSDSPAKVSERSG